MRLRLGSWRMALAGVLALAGCALAGQGVYIHAKAQIAQVLLARAFSASVASGTAVKPWSWADTWPVARLELPRLGAAAIVLAGASGQALAFGPAHIAGTSTAGEPGVAVYAAHRDTHFAFLKHAVAGDRIVVTRSDGRRVRFRVTGTSVVDRAASGIDAGAPGRHLVLATCWPFDARTAGPLRYLVIAAAESEPEAHLDHARNNVVQP